VGTDDEKVLTQADVDALVALVPDAPRAAAAPVASAKPVQVDSPPAKPIAAEPVQAKAPAQQPSPPNPINSNEVAALQKTIADLSRQVSKLANTAQRLDLLEERTGQLAQLIQHAAHSEQPSGEQIAEIQAELRELSRYQNNHHELREDFECAHCKSKGTVAFLTKCTSCGQERWFGWWPRRKAGQNESHNKVITVNKVPAGHR
jgi:hypothetical protein